MSLLIINVWRLHLVESDRFSSAKESIAIGEQSYQNWALIYHVKNWYQGIAATQCKKVDARTVSYLAKHGILQHVHRT